MDRALGRTWRFGGTCVCFAVFGAGSVVLTFVLFPLIGLTAGSRDSAHARVRFCIHHAFRIFLLLLRGLGVIGLEVDGEERLKSCRGCLIVANHPTLLDVVILMSLSPNFQCVVKHQLWENVFLRGVVAAAGFIRNDLSGEDILETCRATFRNGGNLLVFPEGTRTSPGQSPRFLRGFANIAILSKADIQVVVIRCDPPMLSGKEPWYAVPESRPGFRICVRDRWCADTHQQAASRALGARDLVRRLEAHYQEALSNG